MYSYEEKMRAVELYLKYGLSAAAVINELEQHIKKNKLPAKDQRVVLSHNNYIMIVVRLSATIRHFRLQSKRIQESNPLPFRVRMKRKGEITAFETGLTLGFHTRRCARGLWLRFLGGHEGAKQHGQYCSDQRL